jgi:hypothetical protein
VSDETRRLLMNSGAGRHTRLPDLTRLQRACLATLVALVAEFVLGMWLNLYGAIPSADQHAGMVQVITNGPMLLTVHALIGMFLIAATIVLLIRAVKVGDSTAVGLASVGFATVIGAFAAGEFFARDGEAKTSLWMAVLTGIALMSYIAIQGRIAAARLTQARRMDDSPPEPAPSLPYRPPPPRPRPGGGPAPWRASGPQPVYPRNPSGPQPAYPAARSGPQPAYPRAERTRARPRNSPPPQQQWPQNGPRRWQPGPVDAGDQDEW